MPRNLHNTFSMNTGPDFGGHVEFATRSAVSVHFGNPFEFRLRRSGDAAPIADSQSIHSVLKFKGLFIKLIASCKIFL